MKVYKFKQDYADEKHIHIQTANARERIWRLAKIIVWWKKIGYIDKVDIVKDFINKL